MYLNIQQLPNSTTDAPNHAKHDEIDACCDNMQNNEFNAVCTHNKTIANSMADALIVL
jgi:ribonuclease HI